MLITSHKCGYLSSTKRATLSATYTPQTTGLYTIEFYNYRNSAPTCVYNYIDEIFMTPVYEDISVNVPNISSATGGLINLTLDAGATHAGEDYLLLASFGDFPGFKIDGFHIPLNNKDALFNFSLNHPNGQMFLNSKGKLDSAGTAWAMFSTMGPVSSQYLGDEIYFAYVLLSGPSQRPVTYVSNPLMITFIN